MTIRYSIIPKDLAGHLFQITLTVEPDHQVQPDPAGQLFVLPAWIPGSYMVRDFARHIIRISASCNGKNVCLTKVDKHSWRAAAVNGSKAGTQAGTLVLDYDVYAWDLSVRAAHLDQTHGFYNGSSVFLRVVGREQQAHEVDIRAPQDPLCSQWRVATALPIKSAEPTGFGSYVAANYDALIDHPVEMGEFALASFHVHGVPHEVVVTGRVPNLDMQRIVRDLSSICATQIALFEPKSKRAPMDRYVFMIMVVGDGYGGLEHRASTALICNRSDLPVIGVSTQSDGYIGFLGLCSHEYFHTWNVKRIKPAAFVNYDLQQENYTSLLWLFEGFTSYYDDLILLRSRIIDEKTYLGLVSKTLNGVLRGAGRTLQSVAESSFDAWTKYYRQDENSPNAIVSYYTKGSLVALALDLLIRRETAGKKSLDDVMRSLWQEFGRHFYAEDAGSDDAHKVGAAQNIPQGLTEARIEAVVEHIGGTKIKSFFDRYVRGTADIPLDKLYADFGVTLQDQRKGSKPGLGAKLGREANDCKLAQVYTGGAAHLAGLSAGDILVALDGLRVTAADAANDLSRLLGRYAVGSSVQVHAFRRDELMQFTVCLQTDDVPMWALQIRADKEDKKETKKEAKTKTKDRINHETTAELRRPGM